VSWYPKVKWVVCGILLFVNPVVAAVLFVGWMAIDLAIGLAIHGKDQRIKAVELLSVYTDEAHGFRIAFNAMTMTWGGRPWDPPTFIVRRTGDGAWGYKLTPEGQDREWKSAQFLIETVRARIETREHLAATERDLARAAEVKARASRAALLAQYPAELIAVMEQEDLRAAGLMEREMEPETGEDDSVLLRQRKELQGYENRREEAEKNEWRPFASMFGGEGEHVQTLIETQYQLYLRSASALATGVDRARSRVIPGG